MLILILILKLVKADTTCIPRVPKRASVRSSHQRCSVRKGVLRNFVKFTGKHLCQNLFFNKVAGLRPATLLKKRLWRRCFLLSCEFWNISKNTFFTEHLWATASDLFLIKKSAITRRESFKWAPSSKELYS